jgi:regulatory protein
MEESKPKSRITDKKVALAKAQHYCAYQERSQQEVRNKLYDLGLWKDAVEEIISELITDNFLNEERFALNYAQSKFNQKCWGRLKIKQGLKLKGVSEKLIQKALASIDEESYLRELEKLLRKKAGTLNEKNKLKRDNKLQQYALSRGFDFFSIADILKDSNL